MSSRLSPDGLYYWDGQAWVGTLSPDGLHRWNGRQWVPTGGPVYLRPQTVRREPTPWTRPLRIAVVALYAYQGVFALLTPYLLGGRIAALMRGNLERQQAANPGARPLPPGFESTMTQVGVWIVWIATIVGLVIAIIAIVGAIRGWTWAYYAILVVIGLSFIGLPADIANFVNGRVAISDLPAWLYAAGFVNYLLTAALFVWMLIAQIRYGPWAMRRVA